MESDSTKEISDSTVRLHSDSIIRMESDEVTQDLRVSTQTMVGDFDGRLFINRRCN